MLLVEPNFGVSPNSWENLGSEGLFIEDSSPSSPLYNKKKEQQALVEHYQLLGATLLRAEAGFLAVGIPWLFPTARVSRAKLMVDCPSSDYIRQELVTVKTATLESYCEDLAKSAFSCLPNSAKRILEEDTASAAETSWELPLNISLSSDLERFGFTGALGIAFMLLAAVSAGFLFSSPWTLVIACVAAGVVGCGIGGLLSSESARRRSFYQLLSKEVMRRQGTDISGRTRIGVFSFGGRVGA